MKNEACVDLLSIEGLGQTRLSRLLDKFGCAEAALSASKNELSEAGLGDKIAERVASYRRTDRVRKALSTLSEIGARIISFLDPEYPVLLKSSQQPPAVLFVRGNLYAEEKLVIAIVGTRHPTGYGRAAAERLARELGTRGVVIVSGAARGIDTLAHKGCLSSGSRTIAVFGCGIDIAYPPENSELFGQISMQGAVISEFLPGTTPEPGLFPRRNRIIAGISHGVVAVEAGQSSGALITARWAADAGREVFAVPGGIFSDQSQGTNKLLKDGAKLVGRVEDILEEFGSVYRPASNAEAKDKVVGPELDPDELRIYRLLGPEPMHVDSLVEKLRITSSALLPTLLSMELKGVVKQVSGMRFVRIL